MTTATATALGQAVADLQAAAMALALAANAVAWELPTTADGANPEDRARILATLADLPPLAAAARVGHDAARMAAEVTA